MPAVPLRSRTRGPRPLREGLTAWLAAEGLGPRAGDGRVLAAWQAALPAAQSGRVRAVRFARGVLTVETRSAAHMQELAGFTGEGFRKLANQRLGADRIERVVYKLKK